MKNDINPFIPILLGWAVLVGALFVGTVSVAQNDETPQEQRAGETHVLVFAPNQFDHLHHAPEFRNGMRMISEQLARSGVSEQNTIILHGQADTPSRLGTIANLRNEINRLTSVPSEDRIVLFALTHGVNAHDEDYLADQKTSRNGFLSGDESEMIAISEIVDTLGKSPAGHTWVLIDTAAVGLPIDGISADGSGAKFVIADSETSPELLAHYSDDAFGTSPLWVPDNFVVSINRGRRVHQSADENFTASVFLRSFIFAVSTEDRFSQHGQRVLLQETLNTMNKFLAADNHPVPAVSGSFDSNALFLPNRAESAGLIPISPEMWEAAIAQEIETASKLILLYYRPRNAVALLRQTEAQLNSLQQHGKQFAAYAERARILRRMAQAMLGELEQAWQDAQQAGDPLFLYVIHESAPAAAKADAQPQQSMVGRLVRVSKLTTGGTTTTRNSRGQTVRQAAPAGVEYDFAVRLRLAEVPNSPARKLTFIPIDSSRVGTLPSTVFALGNTEDPVSPLLESAFNREEFDSAP
jgi:hypothetical protein